MRVPERLPFDYDQLRKIAELENEVRQIRINRFGQDICCGPAWGMLVGLYVAESKNLKTQTVYLVEATGAARATGLRWISHLLQEGLIQQFQVPGDKRSKFLRLSDTARVALDQYFFAYRNAVKRHLPQGAR